MAFEVFDLELDDAARRELADDPGQFLRDLLQREGLEQANRISMDETMLKPEGLAAGWGCQVYHCIFPADRASHCITICG